MLKKTHHQHAFIAAQYVLSAVAVVHIKVNHRHALQAMALQGVLRCDRNIVEETKSFALFEFYLKPNYEFNQLILMQGSDVEVISPKTLRAEIKEKVAELFKLYK